MKGRMRRKVVWGTGIILCVLGAALALTGCGQAREGRGPAVLVLDTLEAASGAEPDEFGNILASDVQTYVTVGSVRAPTIFEDYGRATFHVQPKDPAAEVSPSNAITLTRYRVTFARSDGRNTPGVDVPYGFDGSATVTISESGSLSFTMVRALAKSEAPLLSLIGGGGSHFIVATAHITFYGTDAAGNAVSVSGQMSVTFADWGDPA